MIQLLELFGGIGAPRTALDNLGVEYCSIDYVEIDPFAVMTYNSLYGGHYLPQDIKLWKKKSYKRKVDLLVHGSPCQDFSIAGNQYGGNKGSNTRSSLLWYSVNIIKNILPTVVVWENVPNVLSTKHKQVFKLYLKTLEDFGYSNHTFVINSVDCGSIQSRKRVYVISSTTGNKPHIHKAKSNCVMSDIVSKHAPNQYYIPSEHYDWFCSHRKETIGTTGLIRAGTFYDFGSPYLRRSRARVYSTSGKAPTLTTFCMPMIEVDDGIRYITPEEAFLIQGFSREQYQKISHLGLTDKQLYKMIGNSMDIKTMEQVLKGSVGLLGVSI